MRYRGARDGEFQLTHSQLQLPRYKLQQFAASIHFTTGKLHKRARQIGLLLIVSSWICFMNSNATFLDS
jgi:hypothetical protein